MKELRKSPQEKKRLDYDRGHFTFSNSPQSFPKQWRQNKALANRQYRRKTDDLLSCVKPLISSVDAEAIAGDLTIGRLRNGVTRKRLRKSGTVSLGEKVRIKLTKRHEMVGRRFSSRRKHDEFVTEALSTLASLDPDALGEFLIRARMLSQGGDPVEWMRVSQSSAAIDRAAYFLDRLERGDARLLDALRRSKSNCTVFQQWCNDANRTLSKADFLILKKIREKSEIERKLKASRRRNESKPPNHD